MGRAGKLNVNIDAVRLADGERAALRAVKEVQGGNHTGAMTGAIVATSVIFFPAAPLFLFMHGKDITIPKGTEITAYVNGDIVLDPVKFASNIAQTQMQPIPPPAAPADAPVVLVAVQPAPACLRAAASIKLAACRTAAHWSSAYNWASAQRRFDRNDQVHS